VDNLNDQFELNAPYGAVIEIMECFDDDEILPSPAFDSELEVWARRALAANGFGDY
jgi:hypothetical protein